MGVFGSLGDCVSTRTVTAKTSKDIDILDPDKLRLELDCVLKDKKLDQESLDGVRIFIDAWDRNLSEKMTVRYFNINIFPTTSLHPRGTTPVPNR